jgi:S-adenosyl methyltransferase
MGVPRRVPEGVDVTRPTPARLYDYYLGGTSNFEVDRVAAERLRLVMPELSDMAWANRGFHQRAARWIAGRGVRQFIDIGSGLPTAGNTHQALLEVVPDARVVYVDIDPMVAAHASGLLTDRRSTRLITADLRDPGALLAHPDLRALINLTEPAGLLMTAVLHFVADASDPWALVSHYVTALAPASYLAVSHGTCDKLPPGMVQAASEMYARATEQIYPRSRAEQERFFAGLELVEPHRRAGPVLCHLGLWGAEDPASADSDGSRIMYCGVARRP